MIGGKPKGKVSLGVYIPSTFYDRQKLFDTLDSRVEMIGQVVTINTGPKVVEEWADARGKSKIVLNLSSHPLLESINIFITLSSNICIFDNCFSNSMEKLVEVLKEKKKDYKVIDCEDKFPKPSILKKLYASKDSDSPILTPKEYEIVGEMLGE